ncbi:MAG TPA: nucleotidyltransferase family protein [Thermoanaerobaculia bacterium]|nr:nucleotidyltransferase family protein [Thermoanaerobaculia bacterium]
MDRLDLVPAAQRAERLFLLDVLAGRERDFDVDADAFLAIAPSKLHPFLHARLRERSLPPALRETLSAAHRRNAMKELRRAAELRRIDTALGAAGIPYLVLKGPVLAATVYPDRASRTMTDLDFLLHESDLPRATAVLGEAGYRMPPQFAGAELAAGDAPPLIHDEPGGPSIELHTMLDSLPDDRDALANMLPSSRRVAIGHGLELRTLDRGELFAHVVLHVSKHHRFEGELRSLLDVALLLHAERDLDWSVLAAAWERRGILEWMVLTVSLAHLLLDAPVPAALAAHAASEEALALAAEQLWIVEKGTVPPRLTFIATGTELSPVHAGVPAHHAPVPPGIAGARARVARGLELLRRVATSGARGGLSRRVFSREVELFRRRERLFAMMEKPSARD